MVHFDQDRLRLGPVCVVLPSFQEALPLIARCPYPALPHCHFCGFTPLVPQEEELGPSAATWQDQSRGSSRVLAGLVSVNLGLLPIVEG